MNQIRTALLLAVTVLPIFQVNGQSGEEIFKTVCSACHTVNKGKLIGPDLSNVYNKQDMPWLISFVRSSQQMIKANDPAAVAIFNEFNKIPMPDNNYSDQQIISIIDYIKSIDAGTGQAANKTDSTSTAQDSTVSPSDSSAMAAADTISTKDSIVQKGRSYFYGIIPFASNAVSCASCHNISDGSLFGGGKLAIDLTGAYTKLGVPGITAILKNPPFPAMKAAVKGALTDEEIYAINSLLKSTAVRGNKIDNFGTMSFLVLRFLGALFLSAFLFLIYDERKIPRGIKFL